MSNPIIYVLAFVAVVVLVQALARLIFAAGDRNKRVNRRLTMMESGMSREEIFSALVRRPPGARSAGPVAAIYDGVERYLRRPDCWCRRRGWRRSPPVSPPRCGWWA